MNYQKLLLKNQLLILTNMKCNTCSKEMELKTKISFKNNQTITTQAFICPRCGNRKLGRTLREPCQTSKLL